MRKLTVPSALSFVWLGCGATPDDDAMADRVGADNAVVDVVVDAPPAFDAVYEGFPPVDIVFSERRDVVLPDGAPRPVCEARRGDAGVFCFEENVTPGLGIFCIRYLCNADDGGAELTGCCRLIT